MSRLTKGLRRVLSEPVFQFLLAGIVLHALVRLDSTAPENLIQVTPDQQRRIIAQLQRNQRHPPTEAEQRAALEAFIDESVLIREAERLGLGENDDIVQRRLLQKMTFVLEAQSQPEPPTPEQLRDYFERHRDEYALDARFTIEHIYFRAGSDSARSAKAQLAQLSPSDSLPPGVGDHFDRGNRLVGRTLVELRDLFGPGFAHAVSAQQSNREWFGPVPSLYGEHLVRITGYVPAATVNFDTVRDAVHANWLRAEQKRLQDEHTARLRQRYLIQIEANNAAP